MIEYKGYVGVFRFHPEDKVFHGRVINTRDLIHFEGKSIRDLEKALKDSVEAYVEICQKHGKKPDKPLSGKLTLRLTPDQHRRAISAAEAEGKSLNAWLSELVEREAG